MMKRDVRYYISIFVICEYLRKIYKIHSRRRCEFENVHEFEDNICNTLHHMRVRRRRADNLSLAKVITIRWWCCGELKWDIIHGKCSAYMIFFFLSSLRYIVGVLFIFFLDPGSIVQNIVWYITVSMMMISIRKMYMYVLLRILITLSTRAAAARIMLAHT